VRFAEKTVLGGKSLHFSEWAGEDALTLQTDGGRRSQYCGKIAADFPPGVLHMDKRADLRYN